MLSTFCEDPFLYYVLLCDRSLYLAAFVPSFSSIVHGLLSISIVHRLDTFPLSSFVPSLQLLGFPSRLIAPFVAFLFKKFIPPLVPFSGTSNSQFRFESLGGLVKNNICSEYLSTRQFCGITTNR